MLVSQNSRTKVKICGLSTLADARYASGAMADYLGFIFYPESPRYVDPAKAGTIINWLEGPKKVGVFVNQPLDDVIEITRKTGIDMVQLHGIETPAYCSLIEKPVIKAIHITAEKRSDDLMKEIEPYRGVADFFLFDTKMENKWGGTGKTFDWSVLKGLENETPFFLSGGLKSDNIVQAIKMVNPYAVDLSSSLEESPGLKNLDKMEVFFSKMNEIWNHQL